MQSRLIIKNFGPIEYVDLDLRNVNLFIGPQASGKSAVAKIYTIFKAPRKFLKDFEDFKDKNLVIKKLKEILEEYNIDSFLKEETEINFESELHTLTYSSGDLKYIPKLQRIIENIEGLSRNFNANIHEIKKGFEELSNRFIFFDIRVHDIFKAKDEKFEHNREKKFEKIDDENCIRILDIIKTIENNLSTNTALYIPAERNFINIIKNYSLNLILNNVPIPKHILSFGAELEKSVIKEIDLSFLHERLVYKSVNGEDRIFIDDENSIKVNEAASGIQSVLPLLIPIFSRRSLTQQNSFVIEEPELNLFPIAQYELIKKLEFNRNEPYWEDYGTIHTYTSHSPYILSALNNLLFANKVARSISSDFANEVKSIVPVYINPYYFTAYQISDGLSIPIFNRDNGLIDDNFIDSASDKMGDDFDSLMDLMSKHRTQSQ